MVSTQFFEHQDRARRSTGRLVILFVLGYLCTCVSVWVVVAGVMLFSEGGSQRFSEVAFHPDVVLWSILPVTIIVLLSSLVKLGQMSGGGAAIAKMFGGVEVNPATTDPGERRLLNVVEEMSIASGCAVPRVFVIPDEAINAFAAGNTPDDAAIGITSQALESFDRDELQGVIAHEFSHIFNGDMRMNKRITACIAGIMGLGVVGWIMVRYIGPALAHSGGRKKEGAAIGLGIILLGVFLVILGFVGTFFGQMIQAAISRQREFLADASAVQYTRHPRGIANALRKIGGWRKTDIANTKVATCGHYFFCSAVGSLFSTHPPLEERIRQIEALPVMAEIGDGGPAAGSAARAASAAAAGTARAPGAARTTASVPHIPGLPRTATTLPGIPDIATTPLVAAMASVGSISADRLSWASKSIASIPEAVRTAARTPAGARAIFYVILGASEKDFAGMGTADAEAARIAPSLEAPLAATGRRTRMVIADLAMPALRQMSVESYKPFRRALASLVRRDGKVTLAEWTLLNALRAHVEWPMFQPTERARKGSTRLMALRSPVVTYLGILAQAGSDPDGAAHALNAGLSMLRIGGGGLPTDAQASLEGLARCTEQLRSLDERDRNGLLAACASVAANDQRVSDDEYDIVRALCDTIGAPLPPLEPTSAPAAA
ncbi:MAG: M48 family metallopeptidase [Planctomycetota bacterium]|nr:M48 family metallopeptidase [Planctomycetota bacterium]MDA1105407.1 M48 family metallopeptidase [Planctomycetota bacterium]